MRLTELFSSSIKRFLGASKRFIKTFAKELLIAFCFAIVAAIIYEYFEIWKPEKSPKWIFEKNREAVVLIEALDRNGNIVQGSGFFINGKGTLVTSYHVIRGKIDIRAKLPSGAYYQLREVEKIDENRDLAILNFEGKDFKNVDFGDSDNLKTGEKIVVISCPYGIKESVTQGIISNPKVEIQKDKGMVQITAGISSGSSGGPVFSTKGQVIGIVSLSIAPTKEVREIAQNLNFAIPINEVKKILTAEKNPQPAPAEIYYAIGLKAYNSKNYDEAERNFEKTIQTDNKHLNAYLGLADIYYKKKLYDKEIEICKKTVILDPKNAVAHFYLGWAYEDKGMYEEALREYERSIELDPKDPDALYSLAILYLVRDNMGKALETIEMLSKINPGTANELRILFKRIDSKISR